MPVQHSLPEVLRAFNAVGEDLDQAGVLARALDGAEALFGARAGFIVLLDQAPGARAPVARIAHFKGLTAEVLRTAAAAPDFREVLDTPSARVDRPGSPAATLLGTTMNQTWVYGVPLATVDRLVGRLVLTFSGASDPGIGPMLASYAQHVAQCLRAAIVHREAQAKRDELAATVFALPTPVVVVDGTGRMTLANSAAAVLLNLPSGFVNGQPVTGKIPPAVEELLARPVDGEAEIVMGTPGRVFQVMCRQVRGAGRVLVFLDVTAMRDVEKLKGDFVAVVGHELRTPLTVLRGYTETLRRRFEDMGRERRLEALDAMDQSARRLEQLIEGVLFLSALEEHKPTLELSNERLGDVLGSHATNERVRLSLPDGDLPVVVDRAMLEVVVYQLVDNAIKYTDGEVILDARVDRGMVKVSVQDRGPGIYSGDVPKLFDRFRQVDQSSTRAKGGMGLGLYMARRIVEAMGGQITCDSQVGEGATFIVHLPMEISSTVAH